MSTKLQVPGQALTVDALAMSAALGGETSDKKTSAWTALGYVRHFAVLAQVTNVAEDQVVTMVVSTASDSSGTGSAELTPASESKALTYTGTATATDIGVLCAECRFIPVGHTHVQVAVSTDDTDGAEVLSVMLLRKLSD